MSPPRHSGRRVRAGRRQSAGSFEYLRGTTRGHRIETQLNAQPHDRGRGGTDLLAKGAVDVRGDAPFPPRLIHHRVCSAAIRRYRALRAHPAWTPQLEQPQHAPRLRPPAPLPSLVPGWGPNGRPFLPCSAELMVVSGPGKGAVPLCPLLAGAGATWSCATACRIFICLFAKVAEKVVHSARSPEAGAPAAATGSPSPTPPPPPSLCPAPTSCPRAGAKLTHPSSGVGGCGRQAPIRAEPAVPSGACTRLGERAGRSTLSTAASAAPLAPAAAAAAPLCALGSRRGSQPPGRRGPPSFAGGIGARASRMRRRPAPRGAGGWELESFLSPVLAPLPARPPPPPGWKSFLSPSRRLWVASWAPRGLAPGAQGPQRHLRAPRVKRAGRMPPESSVSRVRCCSQSYVGFTCFSFLSFFFLNLSCYGEVDFQTDSSHESSRKATLGYPRVLHSKGGSVSELVFIVFPQSVDLLLG